VKRILHTNALSDSVTETSSKFLMMKPVPDLAERLFSLHSTTSDLTELFAIYLEWHRTHAALVECQARKLPTQLISPTDLTELLTHAAANVQPQNMELIIPLTSRESYFALETAECRVSGGVFIIDFTVPVKNLNEKLYFFELHPIQFRASPSRVCHFIDQSRKVAIIGDKTLVFPADFCPTSESFCDAPRDTEVEHIPATLRHLFSGRTFQGAPVLPTCLAEADSRLPTLSQTSADSVVLTTSVEFPLHLKCALGSVDLPHAPIGAVRVRHIAPDCAIITNQGISLFFGEQIH